MRPTTNSAISTLTASSYEVPVRSRDSCRPLPPGSQRAASPSYRSGGSRSPLIDDGRAVVHAQSSLG
jgi:hypothetical protein